MPELEQYCTDCSASYCTEVYSTEKHKKTRKISRFDGTLLSSSPLLEWLPDPAEGCPAASSLLCSICTSLLCVVYVCRCTLPSLLSFSTLQAEWLPAPANDFPDRPPSPGVGGRGGAAPVSSELPQGRVAQCIGMHAYFIAHPSHCTVHWQVRAFHNTVSFLQSVFCLQKHPIAVESFLKPESSECSRDHCLVKETHVCGMCVSAEAPVAAPYRPPGASATAGASLRAKVRLVHPNTVLVIHAYSTSKSHSEGLRNRWCFVESQGEGGASKKRSCFKWQC